MREESVHSSFHQSHLSNINAIDNNQRLMMRSQGPPFPHHSLGKIIRQVSPLVCSGSIGQGTPAMRSVVCHLPQPARRHRISAQTHRDSIGTGVGYQGVLERILSFLARSTVSRALHPPIHPPVGREINTKRETQTWVRRRRLRDERQRQSECFCIMIIERRGSFKAVHIHIAVRKIFCQTKGCRRYRPSCREISFNTAHGSRAFGGHRLTVNPMLSNQRTQPISTLNREFHSPSCALER